MFDKLLIAMLAISFGACVYLLTGSIAATILPQGAIVFAMPVMR
jgi:hypothetical protein